MAANLLDLAREVLTIEAEGLSTLVKKLDASFVKAVDLIYKAKGRGKDRIMLGRDLIPVED